MDKQAQAFIEKVASGDDSGVRSEALFQAQLHAVLNTLADPQATWPAKLRVRYDGPDLSQADKDVFSQLLLHVEDDAAAIVQRGKFLQELQQADTDEAWAAVKRSAAKLLQTTVRMRHDAEAMEVRLMEDIAELEPGILKVTFAGDLLCAMRGRGSVGVPLTAGRRLAVMQLHEVLAVLPRGKKKGGWPYAFFTVGKPLRQLDNGDWVIEIFGGGTLEGRGEQTLRALLETEDFEE